VTRQIRFNAFDMNVVVHQSPGLWRHPDDQASRYKDLSYWTELGKLLERGKFDGIFIADVLGVYDVFGGGRETALRAATQVPLNDPLQLVAPIAAVTQNLGIGITASISFEHPYPVARRMTTADHLSNGRVGWNIVTSYLDSGSQNIGSVQLSHDNRYDVADEYLEVLYKLWEGSWEDGAVLRDRATGVFTDPTKVHAIEHAGEYFTVPGFHLSEPSPQRTPLLYQAGASDRGRVFAAENAEAIFVAAPTKNILRTAVKNIRDELERAGRDRYSARIYNLHTVITDETSEKARAKHAEYERYVDPDGALSLWSGWLGFDLSEYDLDDPITKVESNAVQSIVDALAGGDPDRNFTVRDLATWGGIGGAGPITVGSPSEVADELQQWVQDTDVDGFNLAYAITPGTFEDLVEFIVPELQARGAYQTEYAPGTLREKLFGRGPYLPDEHRGAGFRRLGERALSAK
jgi:FMN-dependent oxidoreductase (nitrilotriacetate monooxygenase family)